MFDLQNTTNHIKKDYDKVFVFLRESETVVDPLILNKRYRSHCPHVTKEHHILWGRDRWKEMDSLPLSFREMINNDPKDPDSALVACVEMWQEIKIEAEKAMDCIIVYEASLNQIPKWLQGNDQEEFKLIREFRKQRILIQEENLRKQQEERKKREKLEEERKKRLQNTYITLPPMRAHNVTMSDGTDLRKVKEVKHLPPHIARAALAEGYKEVKFKYNDFIVPARTVKVDPDKADKDDRIPPVKVHPIHYKRGKNSL